MVYQPPTGDDTFERPADRDSNDSENMSSRQVDDRQHDRLLPSPIQCLPDEMLGHIFVACTQHAKVPPWDLLEICHRWHDIALGTRELWSSICVELTSTTGNGKATRRNDETSWSCRRRHELSTALSWAKAADLEMEFSGGGRWWNVDADPEVDEMMRLACATIGQWRELRVPDISAYARAAWHDLFNAPMPRLQLLEIDWNNPVILASLNASPPPRLWSVTLGFAIPLDQWCTAGWWGSVEKLVLNCRRVQLLRPSTNYIDIVLSQCPLLQEFSCDALHGALDAKHIVSPKLSRLELGGPITYLRGTFPLLELLVLNRVNEGDTVLPLPSTDPSLPTDGLNLPSLDILSLSGTDFRLLHGVNAPRLRYLEIIGFLDSRNASRASSSVLAFKFLWARTTSDTSQTRLIPSETLQLARLPISGTVLQRMMRVAGRDLRELHIGEVMGLNDRAFYEAFHFPNASASRTRSPICPNLQLLRLDVSMHPWNNWGIKPKSVFLWMVDLARNRRDHERSLQSFTARFRKSADQHIWIDIDPEGRDLDDVL